MYPLKQAGKLSGKSIIKSEAVLFTHSVGAGNPEDWYWIIYLKR